MRFKSRRNLKESIELSQKQLESPVSNIKLPETMLEPPES